MWSRRTIFGVSLAGLASVSTSTLGESKKRKNKKKKKRCKGGTVRCKKVCTNLKNNQTNCGACGNVCQGQLNCVNGSCRCQGAICQLTGFDYSSVVALGIAVDSSGNIVAAVTDDELRVYSQSGEILRTIGEFGLEPGEFRSPNGVAIGNDGTLYVADTDNQRVQRIAPNGTIDVWEQNGSPYEIAVNSTGVVYVALDDQIRRLSPSGQVAYSWGPDGTDTTVFDDIGGIAVDNDGAVYATDTSFNSVYRFVDGGAGNVVLEWSVSGTGADPGEFNNPTGIAVTAGLVLIVDEDNDRFQALRTTDGAFLFQWQLIVEDYLDSPRAIAIGPDGKVYVAGFGDFGIYQLGDG